MRLFPGMDGFYLSFPGKQVYWMVSGNGRFELMKQKKEREKEISQWPWISMLPFGILAGYWGDKEVRITAISEYGFQTRLATRLQLSRKMRRGNWHFTIRKQHPTSGFFFVMRLFCRKKRKILMLFIPSLRNRKIIEMQYSTLPCNTASIFAGKWRTMMPPWQSR